MKGQQMADMKKKMKAALSRSPALRAKYPHLAQQLGVKIMDYKELVLSLSPYVGEDDDALDRITFLEFVRDRISDDIVSLKNSTDAYNKASRRLP